MLSVWVFWGCVEWLWFSLPSHLFPTRCFHTTSTDDFHSDLMSCTANLFQILNGESNSTEHGCYRSCLIYIVNLLAFQGVRTGSVYLKLTKYSFLLLCALVYEVFVCWLLNVSATCKCISGTNLLRQFYVLPH